MDNKQIENINIEKSRELFEYEMTEVILKLKGEFATFSGRGSMYEENKIAAENLKLELRPLNEVLFEPYRGEVPNAEISSSIVINEVHVKDEFVKHIPRVKKIDEVKLGTIKQMDIECVELPELNYCFDKLKGSYAEKVEPKIVKVKNVPKTCFPKRTFSIEQKSPTGLYVDSAELKLKEIQIKPVVSCPRKEVDIKSIPDISKVPNSFSVAVDSVIAEMSTLKGAEIVVKSAMIPKVQLKGINLRVPDVVMQLPIFESVNSDSQATNSKSQNEKKYVTSFASGIKTLKKIGRVQKTGIPEMKVPQIKRINICPVRIEGIKLEVPETSIGCGVIMEAPVKKNDSSPKVSIIPEITKQVISSGALTPKAFEQVQVPRFGNDIVKIKKVELNPTCGVRIPKKPNVEEDINRIVALAAK